MAKNNTTLKEMIEESLVLIKQGLSNRELEVHAALKDPMHLPL